MSSTFLHLDIDSIGINVRLIEESYKDTTIVDDISLLYEDVENDDNGDDHPFESALDLAAKELDLGNCKTAVIFVSSFSVSFRNLNLPFSSEKKIEQVLRYELENLMPVSNESYISDFHMLNTSGETNSILSASYPESEISKYFTKLEQIGIKPAIISPKGYAVAVSFLKQHPENSNFIFLYINKDEVTIVLVREKTPCSVRTLPALQNSQDSVANAVMQTLTGFNQHTGIETRFDLFVCCDDDSFDTGQIYETFEKNSNAFNNLGSLEQQIEKSTERRTITSNDLLSGISPDRNLKYLMNFCKGSYSTSSFLKTHLSSIIFSLGLAACLFAIVMLGVGLDNRKLTKQVAALDETALSIFQETFPDKKKVQDPYLQMKANVGKAIQNTASNKNELKSSGSGDIKIINIINELSSRISSNLDLDISRFLLSGDRLILSGSTGNFNEVDTIKSKIESSALFKKVTISSAAADKSGKRVNVKFIIQL